MSITTILLVNVGIPPKVFDAFGHTPEYARKVEEAVKGCITSGQIATGKVQEWAEFHRYSNAYACERKLLDMTYYFATKLLEVPDEL